jgi:hypothetical protein
MAFPPASHDFRPRSIIFQRSAIIKVVDLILQTMIERNISMTLNTSLAMIMMNIDYQN